MIRRRTALIAALFCLGGLPAFAADVPTPAARIAAPQKVFMAASGDTLVIELPGRETEWVRLMGVGSPASVDPHKPPEFSGKAIPPALREWTRGASVYLVDDPSAARDSLGRRLAFAYRASDGVCLNRELIRLGWGYARGDLPHSRVAEFARLEAQARAKGLGLWFRPYEPPPPPPTPTIVRTPPSESMRDSVARTIELRYRKEKARGASRARANADQMASDAMFDMLMNGGQGGGQGGFAGSGAAGAGSGGGSHLCGAPTQDGHPCRNRVIQPGPCYLHR